MRLAVLSLAACSAADPAALVADPGEMIGFNDDQQLLLFRAWDAFIPTLRPAPPAITEVELVRTASLLDPQVVRYDPATRRIELRLTLTSDQQLAPLYLRGLCLALDHQHDLGVRDRTDLPVDPAFGPDDPVGVAFSAICGQGADAVAALDAVLADHPLHPYARFVRDEVFAPTTSYLAVAPVPSWRLDTEVPIEALSGFVTDGRIRLFTLEPDGERAVRYLDLDDRTLSTPEPVPGVRPGDLEDHAICSPVWPSAEPLAWAPGAACTVLGTETIQTHTFQIGTSAIPIAMVTLDGQTTVTPPILATGTLEVGLERAALVRVQDAALYLTDLTPLLDATLGPAWRTPP